MNCIPIDSGGFGLPAKCQPSRRTTSFTFTNTKELNHVAIE
jgi:hypothetical protein